MHTVDGPISFVDPSAYRIDAGVLHVDDSGPLTHPPRELTYSPGYWQWIEEHPYLDYDDRHPEDGGAWSGPVPPSTPPTPPDDWTGHE